MKCVHRFRFTLRPDTVSTHALNFAVDCSGLDAHQCWGPFTNIGSLLLSPSSFLLSGLDAHQCLAYVNLRGTHIAEGGTLAAVGQLASMVRDNKTLEALDLSSLDISEMGLEVSQSIRIFSVATHTYTE